MAKRYIHVNKHKISHNIKHKTDDACLSLKTYKSNSYSKNIKIFDKEGNLIIEFVQAHPSRGIKPLSCGAKVYCILGDQAKVKTE